ncbi:MAG: PAS domain-containing protein [Sneathiellaceae bacterium]
MTAADPDRTGGPAVAIAGRDDLAACGAIILQGYDYWQALCAQAGGLARKSDLRPQDFRLLLSRFVLVELYPDGVLDPRFRLVGTRFEELNGVSLTGRYFRELYLPADHAEMMAVCRDMVADPVPHYLASELRRPGREIFRIRRLLLPLADASGRVAFLAGFIDEILAASPPDAI